VTRISFGAQSLSAAELRRLGRRHSPADVAAAVAGARAAGIESVNLDLLYDVPGQSVGDWETTLRAALALAPDHLSLYALTLDDPEAEGIAGTGGDHLPTAPGARRWRERARLEQDDDRAAHESRHNLVYWEREPYEAVGPGAHAFDGVVRRWNAAAMEPYVAALTPAGGAGRSAIPPGGSETLDEPTAQAEAAILALRLDRGLPAAAASGPFAAHFDWARSSGLLELIEIAGEPRLRLTTRGRLLGNELFARLV